MKRGEAIGLSERRLDRRGDRPGLAVCAASQRATAGQDPHRLGAAPGHLVPLFYQGETKALARHFGKSYVCRGDPLCRRHAANQAAAAGELEIGAFGATAFVYAATNAKLDIRVVADVIQDGAPGYYTAPFVVRKNGPIKTAQDLKGKRVASNAIGSSSDAAMRIFLHKAGLQDRDFITVEANFANMPAMLADGKVDLINMPPQFARGFMDTGNYAPLFTTRTPSAPSQLVFWGARADAIARKPRGVRRLLRRLYPHRPLVAGPGNHDRAVATAAAPR